jgi:putative restriction endonuclease
LNQNRAREGIPIESERVETALIGLSDDLDIMVSRQVNDPASIEAIINPTRRAVAPSREAERPHPAFLAWHREHCFKR